MAGLSNVLTPTDVRAPVSLSRDSATSSSPIQASFPRHLIAGPVLSSLDSSNHALRIGEIDIIKAKLLSARKRGTGRTSRIRMASVEAVDKSEPLKVIISGAPASGKGTQCELIVNKYGLVHISAGDLLREEVAAGTENGKRAKDYMEKGLLVPDEIVVTMVKERLAQEDAQEKGWLLDGYPRSLSQAEALESLGIRPDIFIVLDVIVPDGILVERVVGRRLDPITGKIYHLKYSPPETQEIAGRLTQRFDDTEEKLPFKVQKPLEEGPMCGDQKSSQRRTIGKKVVVHQEVSSLEKKSLISKGYQEICVKLRTHSSICGRQKFAKEIFACEEIIARKVAIDCGYRSSWFRCI